MTTSKFLPVLGLAVMSAMLAGCGVSRTVAPPLQGPSTLALSLTLAANPDVLSMDGASQSRITIDARDANAQLIPNQQLRAEITANGQPVDFGSINARTVVTGSNGEAVLVYTAPTQVPGAAIPIVRIVINPAGTDANAGFDTSRFVAIRLVPPGVISAGGPTASFTVTPANPIAFSDTVFDASTSTATLGSSIISYSWDFGDGSVATGVRATHRFASASTFHVVLTVTDNNGIQGTKPQDIVVGAALTPTAAFVFSPTTPQTGQTINFNGGVSKPGAGHSITRYDWNFGFGAPQSGVTVATSYPVAGTYNVTLTVTDDAGQTATVTNAVSVGSPAPPVAAFTFSPPSPHTPPVVVSFDGSTSSMPSGAAINNYRWNFGDGTIIAGPPAGAAPTGGTFQAPAHPYLSTGTFNVTLTVTDTNNLSGSTTGTVTVGP